MMNNTHTALLAAALGLVLPFGCGGDGKSNNGSAGSGGSAGAAAAAGSGGSGDAGGMGGAAGADGGQAQTVDVTLARGQVSESYTDDLGTATSSTGRQWSVTSGSLPPGLTLNADGTVTGTPEQAGQYELTAEGTAGDTLTARISVTVIGRPWLLHTAGWGSSAPAWDVPNAPYGYVVDMGDPSVSAPVFSATVPYPPPRWSPDGRGLAYQKSAGSNVELHVVDMRGAAPGQAATVTFASAATVDEYQWLADSSGLLVEADAETPGTTDLYWVSWTGDALGAPVLLTEGLGYSSFVASPDSQHVAIVDADGATSTRQIQLVDLAAATIAPAPIGDAYAGTPAELGFSPDGRWLSYVTDNKLQAARIGAGSVAPLPLSPSLPAAEQEKESAWSPDGSRLAFSSGATVQLVDMTSDAPGSRTELVQASADWILWAPNGATLAVGTQPTGGREVKVIDVATNNAVTVYSSTTNAALKAQFSPDSAYLGYVAAASTSVDLFIVSVGGGSVGTAHQVSSFTSSGSNVSLWAFSPKSDALVYTADQDTFAYYELYFVDLTGSVPSASIKLSPPTQDQLDVELTDEPWSPDGSLFGFVVDPEANGTKPAELHLLDTTSYPPTLATVYDDPDGRPSWDFWWSPVFVRP